jgi:hypothetical protein
MTAPSSAGSLREGSPFGIVPRHCGGRREDCSEGGVKARNQADLIWRFQVADEQMSGVPSSLEVLRSHWLNNGACSATKNNVGVGVTDRQMAARDRANRIDRVLSRLREKPVSHARVLYHRYGPEEHQPSLCEVLPFMSGIAAMTPAARRACERDRKQPPRPRSNDVLRWLEQLCHRISKRRPVRDDLAVLCDVRCEAERLLIDAENEYDAWAERSLAA